MKRFKLFVIIPLFSAAFIADSCQKGSEQWNMFRGPNGSGAIETGQLPSLFGPDTNVIWKVDMPKGYSSPVLSDNFIFLTGEEDQDLYTCCLDRATGDLVWKALAPRPRKERLDNRNHPASPSAATDGESVYVFFPDFGLLAYNMKGNELWQLPLGPFNNIYGMGNSPVLAGSQLILVIDQNTGSYIIAVNKSTGEIMWKKDRPEARSGHSTPILYQPVTGELQVLVPGSFRLTAYSAANGDELWWVDGLSFEMKSTPVIWNDLLFINGYASPMNQPENVVILPEFDKALSDFDADQNGRFLRTELPREPAYQMFDFVDLNGDGELDKSEWIFLKSAMASVNGMLAVRLGGEGDMTELNTVWTYHERIPQLPSPLIYKDVLYMIDDRGFITTFKPGTGEIIEKGRLKDGGISFYSSPVGSDGKVYFISRDGKITVLKSGGSIEPVAQGELGEMCFATPAISKGRIYIRTNETLYCFGNE